MGEPLMSTPALASGMMIVREKTWLMESKSWRRGDQSLAKRK